MKHRIWCKTFGLFLHAYAIMKIDDYLLHTSKHSIAAQLRVLTCVPKTSLCRAIKGLMSTVYNSTVNFYHLQFTPIISVHKTFLCHVLYFRECVLILWDMETMASVPISCPIRVSDYFVFYSVTKLGNCISFYSIYQIT